MTKGNWKSSALVGVVTTAGALLLLFSLAGLGSLAFADLRWWAMLLLLSIGSGFLSVSPGDREALPQGQKSVADAFIFLAAMMHGPAAATTLAAVAAFISARRLPDYGRKLYAVGAAIISTFVAAWVYTMTARLLAGDAANAVESNLPLGLLFVPLCLLALTQYALHLLASIAYIVSATRKAQVGLTRESFVWMVTAQVAGAAAAALFYLSWQGESLLFLFVGALIVALLYLLYRFNEQRIVEIKRTEAEKLRRTEQVAQLHMNTIESLAIAIDAKDQTTHGHVRRTQIYALELGKLLGANAAEMEALKAGALLHDIGKLAVPEYILNKPGKLTAAEFEKMKIHPVVGADIIKRVNFPYPVEEIVRFHHEKWDGSGYPQGLKGEGIPLVARIIAVVDFFDTTRCDRPYRVGMKRADSLALLQRMAGTSFDPRIVAEFINNIDYFDSLIAEQDIQEQVGFNAPLSLTKALPDTGLAEEPPPASERHSTAGFRSITEAQREVFALHEIAQTIGSSLNLQDTVTLVSSKLRAIVPFHTCVIFLVDDKSGKAIAAHVTGEHADIFAGRRITVGEGISGWVIANARSMLSPSPELDLTGIQAEIAGKIRGIIASPLVREDGAFGAITLYSKDSPSYTTEHLRLLESVAQHAASALNNALTFEKTRDSALTDPLTDLPNARAFHFLLAQKIAECQRLNREAVSVLCMDLDEFKKINDTYGHGLGDRLLASVAGVIKNQLRQMDTLARFAGDEFVAIMPMTSGEMAAAAAERIAHAVNSHRFPVRTGRNISVGLTIGIACFPADGETAEQLLTAAAARMRETKHARELVSSLSSDAAISSLDAFR